ncbi:MAG: amino acid ABC transporter permease [Sulfitobacter sp.]
MTSYNPILPRQAPGKATALEWVQYNLIRSPLHIFLSAVSIFLACYIAYHFLDWAVVSAAWSGDSRENCTSGGACWPFVIVRFNQFMYGFYPKAEQWRVNLVAVILLVGLVWLLIRATPGKKYVVFFLVLGFPIVTFVLLSGGLGLEPVSTSKWGGLTLTLTIAVTAIAVSLPIGTLLALARRSQMPVVSVMAVTFIEVIRAVPLISVLFMASVLLPIFLPPDASVDKLLRALVGVALFASAYMAEVVRGGLQAVPVGQIEAAKSLGLSHWRITAFVVLPQALRLSIPGIANTFIAIFKDTSLVIIIGLFDLLGMINAGVNDSRWIGMELEGYVFAAAIYWIFCRSISRYSQRLEKESNFGHRE